MDTNNTDVKQIDAKREALEAEIERLKAENKALGEQKSSIFRLAVSPKGAVSMYGLGRFPVTLYAEQWDVVLGAAKQVQSFIEANRKSLKFIQRRA